MYVMAEVQNGVWTGQEPGWDSPINLGAHCLKVHRKRNSKWRKKIKISYEACKWQMDKNVMG